MKTVLLAVLAVVCLCSTVVPVIGAEGPDPALAPLVSKIKDKLKAGKTNEVDLADELKAFDELIAKHKGEKTEEAAQIVYVNAMLYKEVLHNQTKADALLKQFFSDFADTNLAKSAKERYDREQVAASLVAGVKFPDFAETDLAGKAVALADYKGKVVLIDFWTTVNRQCLAEAANVTQAYEKHHTNGFEAVGFSFDKDKAKLEDFTFTNKMTWPQIFDEQGGGNRFAAKFGLSTIPMNYLLDGEGKIIAKNLHGGELDEAVTRALAKK